LLEKPIYIPLKVKLVDLNHNVSSLGLKLNLPGRDDLQDKTITFLVDGEVHHVLKLHRDIIAEVWVDFEHTQDYDSELIIQSSYREPIEDDERALGVSLIALNVNLTEWRPFRKAKGGKSDD